MDKFTVILSIKKNLVTLFYSFPPDTRDPIKHDQDGLGSMTIKTPPTKDHPETWTTCGSVQNCRIAVWDSWSSGLWNEQLSCCHFQRPGIATDQGLPLDSLRSYTTYENVATATFLSWKQRIPLMETEAIQFSDPAEPRTQHHLNPSFSAHIKNTSLYWFLASRQASSSLHQASSTQQQVLHRGEIKPLFCRSMISGFSMGPQTRTTLSAQCPGDIWLAWLCWSEGAAQGLSWLPMRGM